MKEYIDAFFSMGIYAYFLIAFFILAIVFSIVSFVANSNSKKKWLENHKNAVKIELETGNNLITSKQLLAKVIKGEAMIFYDKTRMAIYASPGEIEVELTFHYTRPGVLYKTVTTTWGPKVISLQIEAGNDYLLSFDKKEENFKLIKK